MPTYPPTLQENLRFLQRQINRINSARPGPQSWGPGDGHVRFYAADGRTLFQASSTGASVESRGALTGLTGLLDGIRDTDDAQNGRLNDQHGWIESLGTRMTSAETTNAAQNGRLNDQEGWIVNAANAASAAQARADDAHADAAAAQSRADNAHADAATAQSRADNAYSLADNAVTPGELANELDGLPTSAEWTSIVNTVNNMERWLYNNTTYPQDGGIPP